MAKFCKSDHSYSAVGTIIKRFILSIAGCILHQNFETRNELLPQVEPKERIFVRRGVILARHSNRAAQVFRQRRRPEIGNKLESDLELDQSFGLSTIENYDSRVIQTTNF